MRTRNLGSDIMLYIETVIVGGASPLAPLQRARGMVRKQNNLLPSPVGEGWGEALKWRGYDVQSSIDARDSDKLPCAEDSNRHTESLKLATDLLLMLDGDKAAVLRLVEAQPWVKEIIEERDENVAQTVDSAADCVAQKERKYASSLPSKAMLAAIKEATGLSYVEITKTKAQKSVQVTNDDH